MLQRLYYYVPYSSYHYSKQGAPGCMQFGVGVWTERASLLGITGSRQAGWAEQARAACEGEKREQVLLNYQLVLLYTSPLPCFIATTK